MDIYYLFNPAPKISTQPQQLKTTAGSRMWNPNHHPAANQEADDDDSWEIRAFKEDTNNALGTTWPPRSYTCTFCRREFKSAQALGGHMNVHRRDRAQLHQTPAAGSTNPATSVSTLIINRTHQQELLAKNGLCLLYSLPNPNSFFSSTTINLVPHKNCSPAIKFPVAPPHSINSSLCQSSNTENSASTGNDNNIGEDSMKEELDLELRLGRKHK